MILRSLEERHQGTSKEHIINYAITGNRIKHLVEIIDNVYSKEKLNNMRKWDESEFSLKV